MQPLRKIERTERKFTVLPGNKPREVRLPLTIKMFISCTAAALGFVFIEAADSADTTTRTVIGILVALTGSLAFLVYKDVVRRMKGNEDSIKVLDHKIDKAIRAFTGILVATHPEKASEIYQVSEAFFKEE